MINIILYVYQIIYLCSWYLKKDLQRYLNALILIQFFISNKRIFNLKVFNQVQILEIGIKIKRIQQKTWQIIYIIIWQQLIFRVKDFYRVRLLTQLTLILLRISYVIIQQTLFAVRKLVVANARYGSFFFSLFFFSFYARYIRYVGHWQIKLVEIKF